MQHQSLKINQKFSKFHSTNKTSAIKINLVLSKVKIKTKNENKKSSNQFMTMKRSSDGNGVNSVSNFFTQSFDAHINQKRKR